MDALFVDLPNFYSHLAESGIEEQRLLRDYFLYWFDFDRLAYELTEESSSVWVFHSNRRFGPRQNRIEGTYLNNFINRTNSLRGVTARDVNIPGEQREPISYECEHCGQSGRAQWESEKGIDASLTVHLFDTMDSWDVAYLLSGDADFVPAVSSLRRRGKIVIGAGFSDASSALIRECYDYINLSELLREDVAAYQIFRKGGLVDKWFHSDVESLSVPPDLDEPIRLSASWSIDAGFIYDLGGSHRVTQEQCRVYLRATGPIDLLERHQYIEDFKTKFPQVGAMNSPDGEYSLILSTKASKGIGRRLESFVEIIEGAHPIEVINGQGYELTLTYNDQEEQFEPSV